MDRKWLKWSLIVCGVLFILVFVGFIVYLLIPAILSFLIGGGAEVDCYPYPAEDHLSTGPQSVTAALSSLCLTAKTLVGAAIMLLLIAASVFGYVPVALALYEIITNEAYDQGKKILWVVLMVVFGFFGALAYYFVERKDRP